jgi:hypothetical protein
MADNTRLVGQVIMPISDGMNERCVAFIQPALEPAFREKEVTNGAPKYGTTSLDNLGIA